MSTLSNEEVWSCDSHASPHHPRRLLAQPRDKVERAEQGELMYQIPCKNCCAEYIGETGRLLKTRLDEHRKDVDNTNNEKYTRSGNKV